MILIEKVYPKPEKMKHGSRRLAQWEKNRVGYALALCWWLKQDVVTRLGGLVG